MNKKLKKLPFAEKIRVIADPDTDRGYIPEALAALQQGGVLIIPTTTLYGLGVMAFNPEAVRKIYRLKHRSQALPILILIHRREDAEIYARRIPAAAAALMDAFWPGNVTLVVEAAAIVPDILCGGTGKIGIRQCRHPVTAALVQALGAPLTGTSANISGRPGCRRISELEAAIAEQADLILDAGDLNGGVGSTVVDVSANPIAILREGAVSRDKIFTALQNSY